MYVHRIFPFDSLSFRLNDSHLKKVSFPAEMISARDVTFFIVISTDSEKSCLKFFIPTESRVATEEWVSHNLKVLKVLGVHFSPFWKKGFFKVDDHKKMTY